MESMPESPHRGASVRELDPRRCSCKVCNQRAHCLPGTSAGQPVEDLGTAIRGTRSLADGQILFRQSEALSGIYAIRSGCFKSFRASPQGDEQVFGFHLPGDLIGLDAIHSGAHDVSVMSLGDSLVCRFDFQELERLADHAPALNHQLLRIMSRELVLQRDRDLERPANARVAAFLSRMGERMARRGVDRAHFNLPMPRRDIANYLGLAPETVSRILAKLLQQQIIGLRGREVTILDPLALEKAAACG